MTQVEAVFDWIEHTGLSRWVVGESMLAFPTILTVHTIGMGFLAGIGAIISLRILGFAPSVPLGALEKFYTVAWLALAANFISGVLLFIGYPYKAATNPVFYVKLALIALAVTLLVKIRKTVLLPALAAGGQVLGPSPHAKRLALLSLFAWASAILAGRLLAYTYVWLRVGIPGGF